MCTSGRRAQGGGPTSERNTSTLHFKVIRTIFFELCVSLVIILDMPVHQESTEKPGKGPLSYPTAAQKSIKYRRTVIIEKRKLKGAGRANAML